MLAIRITQMREEAGLGERNQVLRQVRVEFMVGEQGPFVEHFPRAGFEAGKARTKLEEFARELEQLTR